MMDQGSIRNFEQLQEEDSARRTPRGVTIAFVVLGGACVVFAVMALGGRKSRTDAPKADPLGELVAQRTHGGGAAGAAVKPTDLTTKDVTFPGILSDETKPTTALAAVRPAATGASSVGAAPSVVTVPVAPPPPADRLPVVPLPAQNVLEASPVVTNPRDGLTKAASDAAQIDSPPAPTTPPGHDGGFQLQVSSFRTLQEANSFSDQLRARGHKAYVQEADVPGRGTWFRVRIGPFTTQHAAQQYRAAFEAKEHVVPFIVPPASATK
jgi:DedD protein